jgi:hypothetical protein
VQVTRSGAFARVLAVDSLGEPAPVVRTGGPQ